MRRGSSQVIAKLVDAQRLQIRLEHFVSSVPIEPAQDAFVRNAAEGIGRKSRSSSKPHLFAPRCLPDDRCVLRAGVLDIELQTGVDLVGSAADDDGQRCWGRCRLFELADRVAGSLERGQWLGLGTGIGVVAVGGNKEGGRGRGVTGEGEGEEGCGKDD